MLLCQQWMEQKLFALRCLALEKNQDRDVLIDRVNKLRLRPPWRPTFSRSPSGSPEPKEELATSQLRYTRTGTPIPDDAVVGNPTWDPRANDVDDMGFVTNSEGQVVYYLGGKDVAETFSLSSHSYEFCIYSMVEPGVEENWLDDELRQLPLFLVMAGGSRSYRRDTNNVHATIKSPSPGGAVDLRLLRASDPRMLKQVPIRHVLPIHPSVEHVPSTTNGKQHIVFIKGPLKCHVRLLHKVEGDRVWVRSPNNGNIEEYSKYEFVLSREVKQKGNGIGKSRHIKQV
jgi:hypothetical protein